MRALFEHRLLDSAADIDSHGRQDVCQQFFVAYKERMDAAGVRPLRKTGKICFDTGARLLLLSVFNRLNNVHGDAKA